MFLYSIQRIKLLMECVGGLYIVVNITTHRYLEFVINKLKKKKMNVIQLSTMF